MTESELIELIKRLKRLEFLSDMDRHLLDHLLWMIEPNKNKKYKIRIINKQIAALTKCVYARQYPIKSYRIKDIKKLSLLQIKGIFWRQATAIDKQRKKIMMLRHEKIELLKRIRYFLSK